MGILKETVPDRITPEERRRETADEPRRRREESLESGL